MTRLKFNQSYKKQCTVQAFFVNQNTIQINKKLQFALFFIKQSFAALSNTCGIKTFWLKWNNIHIVNLWFLLIINFCQSFVIVLSKNSIPIIFWSIKRKSLISYTNNAPMLMYLKEINFPEVIFFKNCSIFTGLIFAWIKFCEFHQKWTFFENSKPED